VINLQSIINSFEIEGAVYNCELYGSGHINDTYKVIVRDAHQEYCYILQRINHNVFKDVEGLMNNIRKVTEYIIDRLKDINGDTTKALRLIHSRDGKNFVKDALSNYFRCYNCIPGAVSIESVPTLKQFEISGSGFGLFQKYLDGFPTSELIDTIPNFHNTEDRYNKFIAAVKADPLGRLAGVAEEVAFFVDRADYSSRVTRLIASGDIPLRVTHNDTKLNNMMIDLVEEKAVCAIDLDTVMAGSILYDFGDSIRAGANLGAEDEQDLSKVAFSLEHFEAFTAGFIGEVKDILTPSEVENMAFGAILMTYECGMRFLTDHLMGDTYFKIHRKGHNLDRTRTQIKMVADMESVFDEMNAIVKKHSLGIQK